MTYDMALGTFVFLFWHSTSMTYRFEGTRVLLCSFYFTLQLLWRPDIPPNEQFFPLILRMHFIEGEPGNWSRYAYYTSSYYTFSRVSR